MALVLPFAEDEHDGHDLNGAIITGTSSVPWPGSGNTHHGLS